jgi:NDP-sugar pyrophosphorylase family protein
MTNIGIKKAFILAGGEGTRLRPLTYEIAKPLVPVCGKPVLEWNIELCKRFGIKEIVIALGYKAQQVQAHCEQKIFGVKINCNIEEKFLGTGGALKFAQNFFESEKKFLMMNGDECKEIDLAKLNNVFETNNAIGAVALTPVDFSQQSGGAVRLNEKSMIVGWDEHAEGEEKLGIHLINAGAYILSQKIFDYIPVSEVTSIEKQTFPQIIKENKLFGSNCVSQFFQTDNFERYERAIFGWKPPKA